MATVQEYNAQRNIQANMPEAQQLNTFAGVQGIAGGLNNLAEVHLRQREYDSQLWAINRMSELRIAALKSADEAKGVAEPGAPDFANIQNSTYKELSLQYREGAPSTRAQQIFDLQAARYGDDFFNNNLNYEFNQRNDHAFKTQVEAGHVDSQALLQTPDAWKTIYPSRMALIENLIIPGSEKEKLANAYTQEVSETVVRAVGNTNPQVALDMLDGGHFPKSYPGFNLAGPKLDNLRWHLTQRVKTNNYEARAELSIAVQNSLADYEMGVSDSPMPVGTSIEQLKSVLTPMQFEKYQRGVESATAVRSGTKAIQFGPTGVGQTIVAGNMDFQKAYLPYSEITRKAANEYGVDEGILAGMLWAESKFNPKALGPETKSSGQAKGIAQFVDKTAERFGIDPYNPDQAIPAAAMYVRQNLNMFGGDYQKALAAYNWGEGNVKKVVDKYGSDWLGHAPSETQKYVNSILTGAGGGVGAKKANNKLLQIDTAERKLRASDPAAAADRNLASIDPNYNEAPLADKLARRQAMQTTDFKMPEHRQGVLTKAEAEGLAMQISSADIDQAQQTMGQIKQQIVGTANDAKSQMLWNKVFSEIIDKGKLDKGYMFMDFTAGRMYGNMFARALQIKTDKEAFEGVNPEIVKSARNSMYSHQGYQNFLHTMSITGGAGGSEYSATFAKTFEKTVFLALRDPHSSPSKVVDAVYKDLIGDQQASFGTFFVPTEDPYTKQKYDTTAIANTLENIGDHWLSSSGKFEAIATSTNNLLPEEYLKRSIANADNLVWVTNEDSSGVYRAIKAVGAPGIYIPLLDKKGNRYGVKFTDVMSIYNDYHGTGQAKPGPASNPIDSAKEGLGAAAEVTKRAITDFGAGVQDLFGVK